MAAISGCWLWDVDPVLLPIAGPIQIRWYGVFFLSVFVVGYLLLRWQTRRAGYLDDVPRRFVHYAVFGVVVGGWFGHRIFYEWDRIVENPLFLIDVRHGLAGLSSHGSTLGLIVGAWIFARLNKIPVGEMFDRFSFSVAMGAALVRIGNLFNSEIIGTKTSLPWAVCYPPEVDPLRAMVPRHPSQIYEALIGFGVLGILLFVDRVCGGEKRPRWLLIGVFFGAYFSMRFGVEFFKEHQVFAPGALFDMGHYLSIPGVLLGVCLIVYSLRARKPAS